MERAERERIIIEAENRLEVGTECSNDNIGGGCKFTITSNKFEWSTRNFNSLLCTGRTPEMTMGQGYFTVWKEGIWCDIIRHTFEKELEIIREIIKED